MITVENYDQISEAVDNIVIGFSQLLTRGQKLDKNDIHALANMFVLSLCQHNDQLDEFPEILTEENMEIGDQIQFALDKKYEEEQESEFEEEDPGMDGPDYLDELDDEDIDQISDGNGTVKPVFKLNSAKFIKDIK